MDQQIIIEYSHVIAFAERKASLLGRLARTGEPVPTPPDWRGSDAYLRDLRSFVEAAERRKGLRDRPSGGSRASFLKRLSAWPWMGERT